MENLLMEFVLSVMASIVANIICGLASKWLNRKGSNGNQPK